MYARYYVCGYMFSIIRSHVQALGLFEFSSTISDRRFRFTSLLTYCKQKKNAIEFEVKVHIGAYCKPTQRKYNASVCLALDFASHTLLFSEQIYRRVAIEEVRLHHCCWNCICPKFKKNP